MRRFSEWSECEYKNLGKTRGVRKRAAWKCTVCEIRAKVKKDKNNERIKKSVNEKWTNNRKRMKTNVGMMAENGSLKNYRSDLK